MPPLQAAVEVAAYRIVQEALTNVMRHAARRACTSVSPLEPDAVLARVDGRWQRVRASPAGRRAALDARAGGRARRQLRDHLAPGRRHVRRCAACRARLARRA